MTAQLPLFDLPPAPRTDAETRLQALVGAVFCALVVAVAAATVGGLWR